MTQESAKRRKRRGRSEGGIRYDEARKLWVASVSLGYHADGRRNRPVAYGKTKALALAGLERMKAEAGRTPAEAAGMTVAQLLDRWLAAHESRLARRTHENRAEAVALLKRHLGGVAVASLRPLHVEDCHRRLAANAAPSYAWHAARALSGALAHAVKLGVLSSSPAAQVTVPPLPRREMLTLTAAQARSLVAATRGYSFLPLLVCALATGCRQGELLALGWDDLDLARGTLAVRRSLSWTKAHGYQLKQPKTAAARRTLNLPPSTVAVLLAHRKEREAAGMLRLTVFVGRGGAHLHRAKITEHLKGAIDRTNGAGAGIPRTLRFHDLRHTHASLLLSQGQSLRAVSARLGHADPAMTLRVYAHCLPGDDARLAAAVEALLSE